MRAYRVDARCLVDLALRAGPYDGLGTCVQFVAAWAVSLLASEDHRVIVLSCHCRFLCALGEWLVSSRIVLFSTPCAILSVAFVERSIGITPQGFDPHIDEVDR